MFSVPSPAFSHLVNMRDKDVRMESAMFGAFRESALMECMNGSGASKKDIELLVRDMRGMLVQWAYDVWSYAIADDAIPTHILHT